jgi:hypothetical protein
MTITMMSSVVESMCESFSGEFDQAALCNTMNNRRTLYRSVLWRFAKIRGEGFDRSASS